MEVANNGQDDTTHMLGARCQVNDWTRNPQKYSIDSWCEGYDPQYSHWHCPFDLADDYHLFGLLYQRPTWTVYCDRSLVVQGTYDWCWDDGSDAPAAHILVNLAIGGGWAGRYGIDNNAFPNVFNVEYVKAYAKRSMQLDQGTCGKDYELT